MDTFAFLGLYLDHAGSTLYSKSLIEHSLAELTQNCFGNPHSRNTPSRLTTDLIDQTRIELLNFFQADPNQYTLLFTSGYLDTIESHNLKLVTIQQYRSN